MASEVQLEWSLNEFRQQIANYLAEEGYAEAAANPDLEMLGAAADAVMAHHESQDDLRADAIVKDLIAA